MDFFIEIEGAVLLKARGVYSSAKLYQHDGKLFAKKGGSFVRLLPHNSTSVNNLTWSTIRFFNPEELFYEVRGGDVVLSRKKTSKAA